MAAFKHKIGDTFRASCVHNDPDGDPVNLTAMGVTVASSVLDGEGLRRFALTVTLADQTTNPGEFVVEGDSSTWSLGCVTWDIQYTTADTITSTESVVIETVQDVTL